MSRRVIFCEEGQHIPEQALADSDSWDNEKRDWVLGNENICVIVDSEGKATNTWADGTVGVPSEVKTMAQIDEEPRCIEHPDSPVHWVDVE